MTPKTPRSRIHRLAVAWSLILGLCSSSLLAQGTPQNHSDADSPSERGTGLKKPTPEQLEFERKNVKQVIRVRPNRTAVERVNALRKSKGLPPLKITPAKSDDEAVDAVIDPVGSSGGPVGASAGATTTTTTSTSGTSQPLAGAGGLTWVDNSQDKFFPPIGNQASLNSCVAFSMCYYQMSYAMARLLDRDLKGGDKSLIYSPKWVYNMINGGVDEGTWWEMGYRVLEEQGCATWQEFPYTTTKGDPLNYLQWSQDTNIWTKATSRRISSYQYVSGVGEAAGLQKVKDLLLNGEILLFGTYIGSWVYGTVKDDPATINDDGYANKAIATGSVGAKLGHSMTIVGYNDDIWVDSDGDNIVDTGEKGALRVANSWGTTWQDGGFCWVAYNAISSVLAPDYGTAVYRITVQPNYQPKKLLLVTMNSDSRKDVWTRFAGTASTVTATPSTTSDILRNYGGKFAFDGTTTPCDTTFAFDVSDYMYNPTTASTVSRYWFQLSRYTTALGNATSIKSMRLLDVASGVSTPKRTGLPVTANIISSATTLYLDQVNVVSASNAPVANSQTITLTEDSSASVTLSGTSPTSTKTYVITKQPSNGTLSGTAPNLTYTPKANYYGTDSIEFSVDDGTSYSPTATISLNVTPVYDAPIITSITASPESVDWSSTTAMTSILSVAASSADNLPLSYSWALQSGPSGGKVGFTGKLKATATASFTVSPGTYVLKVTVSDGTTTLTPTVTVNIRSYWDQWCMTNFGSYSGVVYTDDPDGDGITNLVEYALGGNPKTADTSVLPKTSIVTDRLAITFPCAILDSTVTLKVQGADSISGPWTDLAKCIGSAPFTVVTTGTTINETGTAGARTIQVLDPYTITAKPQRFMRIQVIKP